MRYREFIIEKGLFLLALTSILIIVFIAIFIFREGAPVITRVGVFNFIFGQSWRPSPPHELFGILPMIIGTFGVTFGAILFGVVLGVSCAIFLSEIAPPLVRKLVRPAIEVLQGIPSVVYGFFGLMVIVPWVRDNLGGDGFSMLAGSLVLAIMILPTIITISEDSIRSIPKSYKEASLAIGATHWQTIKNIILPSARTGIIAGAILGMARALGETMAVIMVLGNAPIIPQSILDPVRALTATIGLEMAYAHGPHRQALFAVGIVLFVVIMSLVLITNIIRKEIRH